MDLKYTKDGLKSMTYIVVNIKSKAGNNLETKGLFLALRPVTDKPSIITDPDDLFIWIYASGNAHIFNTEYYNIHSINIGFGQKAISSHQTPYLDTKTGQSNAVERLKSIQSVMGELGRIKETGLMDISTYTNLPKVFEGLLKESTNEKETAKTSHGVHYPVAQSKTNYSSAHTYVRKEVTTSFMKRTSRYPTKNAIDTMKSRIEAIKKDEYKPPKLKKTVGDDEGTSDEETYNEIYGPYNESFC